MCIADIGEGKRKPSSMANRVPHTRVKLRDSGVTPLPPIHPATDPDPMKTEEMEPQEPQKHVAVTSDGEFNYKHDLKSAFAALKSGGGWVLIKRSCNIDSCCQ